MNAFCYMPSVFVVQKLPYILGWPGTRYGAKNDLEFLILSCSTSGVLGLKLAHPALGSAEGQP